MKLMTCAFVDSVHKDFDDTDSLAYVLIKVRDRLNNVVWENMQNYDGVCEVFRSL